MSKYYQKPDLPYEYDALEPFLSEELLRLHYDKHHQAYVDGANDLLKQLDQARKDSDMVSMRDILKHLSYTVGGHVLHSIFWSVMRPADQASIPQGKIKQILEKEFGSIDRFKQEFAQTAKSVEGSGWAALTYCHQTKRPVLMQIEKHNVNLYPGFKILMVLDVWEHAYYKDYDNRRGEFVNNFWSVVNWQEVERRLTNE
jgi:Fe-Mn family superoxide dismutase